MQYHGVLFPDLSRVGEVVVDPVEQAAPHHHQALRLVTGIPMDTLRVMHNDRIWFISKVLVTGL